MQQKSKYQDIGKIKLSMKDIPNLSYLDKLCRMGKIASVDIFVEVGREINTTIIAQDLSTSMIAMAKTMVIKEQDKKKDSLKPKSNIEMEIKDDTDLLSMSMGLDWMNLVDKVSEDGVELEIPKISEIKDIITYRFSTSANIVSTFTLFDEVELELTEEQIILKDEKTLTEVIFNKRVTMAKLEEYDRILENMKWEELPLERIKTIIPLLDKIEESAYKQHIILKDDTMYSSNDSVVLESKLTEKVKNGYLVNFNMLRALKFSPKKTENPVISRYKENFVAIKVDNILLAWEIRQEILPSLMTLLKEVKDIPVFKVNKDFMNKLKLVMSFGKELNLNLVTVENGIELRGNNIRTMVPAKTKPGLHLEIDFDILETAIKLADSKEPILSVYPIGERFVLMSSGRNKSLVRLERFKSIN